MSRRVSRVFSVLAFALVGCDYVVPDLQASYISDLGTFAQRAELVGTLYQLDTNQDPPSLQIIGEEIAVPANLLRTVGPADFTSSRVTGASADVIEIGRVVATDVSLEFDARIEAVDAEVERLSGATATRLINDHYKQLRLNLVNELGREPEKTELPMRVPEIADIPGQYYLMITGGDRAQQLDISFGAPEGTTNGLSLTVGRQRLSGVTLRGDTVKECSQPENREERARCSVSVTAFTATLKTPSSFLRIEPVSLPSQVIADAFRAK